MKKNYRKGNIYTDVQSQFRLQIISNDIDKPGDCHELAYMSWRLTISRGHSPYVLSIHCDPDISICVYINDAAAMPINNLEAIT